MLVMVVFFIAFRWIHLSTPIIRLFLLVLILLLMPTLNFLPVWFALSLLRFRLPSRLPMMFMDNRPLLVMRSNLWASGYDVDGTDQTSLGQFSGRVQQTYKHSVPRFFVPEHGTMFTLALVRFPPTATKEIQYLNAK